MKAKHLQTEYRTNPMGIGNRTPRLSWNDAGCVRQSAYEIVAAKNGAPDWTTGRVDSASMHARYGGEAESRDVITWKVRIWDENGQASDWSEEASFEMGLLDPEADFQATWIAGVGTDTEERLPADDFRRTFVIEKPVQKARLYATARGVYSFAVDGVRDRSQVLAPGCSEYEKHLYMQTYALPSLEGAAVGPHTLTFTVGDGWYKGKIGSDNTENFFGRQKALLAQLELTYEDGTTEVIATDSTWAWCNDGPILHNDLKDGVVYDFNKTPSYGGKAEAALPEDGQWSAADRLGHLYPADHEGIKEQEHFAARLLITPSGKTVLDFGRNISGYVRCHFKVDAAKAGKQVALHLGEVLDHGEFTNANFRDAYGHGPGKMVEQEMVFTLSGRDETYDPDFFYSGFQYALVEGLDEVDPADFTAIAVYSGIPYTGKFTCSNAMLNAFFENTIWSQKDNFVDVPTDCPTREKSAWTGDAQVFCKTALYNADAASFYAKWLKDMRDCQREDGRIDNVCPKIRGIQKRDALEGSVGWADAAVIIPYTLWKQYGDDAVIMENRDLMLGWMHYMIDAAANKMIYQLPEDHIMYRYVKPYLLEDDPDNKYIIESGVHWGEWSEPKDVYDVPTQLDLPRPKQEETTAYMHYSMGMLEEMLEAIGDEENAAVCREYAAGAKRAYQHHFVTDGRIESKRPCKLVRPLWMGLLEEEQEAEVAADLNRLCVERDYKVGTGFLSTPFLLPVLVKYGYVDTAYRMLENTEEPGWLAMVKAGATSVWESYNGFDGEGHPRSTSFNHYSPGAVCSFLYEYVCGIAVDGENHFTIRPVPGGTLTHAEAEVGSAYGAVKSAWEKEEKEDGEQEYTFRIEIPANCTASLTLPDGRTQELAAGEYCFIK